MLLNPMAVFNLIGIVMPPYQDIDPPILRNTTGQGKKEYEVRTYLLVS